MEFKILIENETLQHTLSIRTRTSLNNLAIAFDDGYAKILSYLKELGVEPACSPYAAYYNQDMQDLDVEMGFPVAQELPDKGEIKAGIIPERKIATCMHEGPYSGLDAAYSAIYRWIEENKLEITGVHYDYHISDPDKTPENELLTKVVIPLK